MSGAPFQLNVPFDVFKSEDDGRMLFGGFVSSQKPDREAETIIQKGLDFQPWVDTGWFNDNHDQKLSTGGAVVGVPVDDEPVKWLKKGDTLPLAGDLSDRSGWYVQGEFLDTPAGRAIYATSKALQKANTSRRLGMSLEGHVVRRKGPVVMKAQVRNIAITQKPVSHDTVVEVLAKALEDGERIEAERPSDPMPLLDLLVKKVTALETLVKALAAGQDIENPADPVRVDGSYVQKTDKDKKVEKALTAGQAVAAPAQTSAGDGFALRQEDLDKKARRVVAPGDKEKKKRTIDFNRAVKAIQTRLNLNRRDAVRVTSRIFKQLQQGRSA